MVETVRLRWFRPEKWGLDPCLLPDYYHFFKICTEVLGTLRYAPSPRAGHMSPYKGRRSPKNFCRRNGGSAWRLPQTSRPNVRIPYPPRIEVHHIPRRCDDGRDFLRWYFAD